jgi:hypothetical protein
LIKKPSKKDETGLKVPGADKKVSVQQQLRQTG